jgi:hypothetical protein
LLVKEHLIVDDIARELIPPPAHQLLVALGDGELALRLAVAVTILIVEEARRWREELDLLDRLHIRKVEVTMRAPEMPRSRVVRTRRQLRRVVRAEREAEAAGVKLSNLKFRVSVGQLPHHGVNIYNDQHKLHTYMCVQIHDIILQLDLF